MSILKPLSVAMLAATLAACAAPMSASKPEPLNNEDWYQVRSETQVILFDDLQVFKDYLASGQAPSMRTLEEKDANGLEVVLALRAEDQGKPLDKIAAYRFFKVAQVPAHPFYGEVRQDGSIYVFKRYGDMQDMVKLGEPIFRYTDIGSGPNGQTVTYGLQKEEGRPDATIAPFKMNHMLGSFGRQEGARSAERAFAFQASGLPLSSASRPARALCLTLLVAPAVAASSFW